MRALEKSHFEELCNSRGLETIGREWPVYRDSERRSLLIKLPGIPYRAVALARFCFPEDFDGALVWFRDWGIWNQLDDDTGMRTLERLRSSFGETRPLQDAPGHLFAPNEFLDARSVWTVPVIFGWDAILFPESSDYFVFNSHDEVIAFVSRTEEAHIRLSEELKDWKPEVSDWYFH